MALCWPFNPHSCLILFRLYFSFLAWIDEENKQITIDIGIIDTADIGLVCGAGSTKLPSVRLSVRPSVPKLDSSNGGERCRQVLLPSVDSILGT